MKFAAIGDLHLEKPGLLNIDLEPAMLATVEAIFDDCSDCDFIIMLGDVCDAPTITGTGLSRFLRLIDKCSVPLHVILGNHDYHSDGSHSLEVLETLCDLNYLGPTVKVYSKPTVVDMDGQRFEFLPFPAVEAAHSKGSICVGHFSRVGAARDNGSIVKASEEGVAESDENAWIMGHIHLRQRVGNTLYVGTPYQTTFGETREKGYGKFTVRNGKLSSQWVPIKKPKFELVTKTIKRKSDWSKMAKYIERNRNRPDYTARYHVFATDEARTPDTFMFLANYPEVTRLMSGEAKKPTELKDLMEAARTMDTTYNLTDGLDSFMTKRGLNEKERKLAHQFVNDAASRAKK